MVCGFVDLKAEDDLEGKTEIGKSTQYYLGQRADSQREAPEDRWW